MVAKKKYSYQRSIVPGLLLLTISLCGFGQSERGTVLYHKFNPAIVTIDGKLVLYYELHLKNMSSDSVSIINIASGEKGDISQRYDEHDIMERFVNRSGKRSTRPTLAPWDSAVVYMETQFLNPPAVLDHVLQVEVARKETQTIAGLRIACTTTPPPVIGPPLGKGNWAAVYDPSWLRGHRRVLFQHQGKERIPGRFAIDFILLDNKGKYSHGDENIISNWIGYDADVLAVANGTVVSIKNDFSESKTLSAHPSYPADKATGNYISIDIGGGRIAFYEHLKPGSIKVKVGQKVKKGDVIGSIGFTGQTTGPHLHFHLADGNSPLGAEGIPFVFEHYELLGYYLDFTKFGKDKWIPSDSENNKITNERPGPNTVIRF